MNDTITVRGFVATEPKLRQTLNNTHVTDFRMGSTARRYDSERNEWVDAGSTNWYTVTCFRYMAANVAASLQVGDPVLVQGRLKMREWINDAGHKRLTVEIDATALGPDLAMGTAKYSRAGATRNGNQSQEQNREQQAGSQQPVVDPETGEILEDADVPGGEVDNPAAAEDAMTGLTTEAGDTPMIGGVGPQPGERVDLDQESETVVTDPELTASFTSNLARS